MDENNIYMQSITEQVIDIVSFTAQYIKNESINFSRDTIETKSINNFVSYVDKEAEKLLVEKPSALIPDSGFITEEGTSHKTGENYCWIIDPLDGTSNYIHRSTPYAISVALMYKQEIIVGVINEITRDECFYAWRGSKAYMNGQIINVSDTQKISDALISTGRPHNYMDYYSKLLILMDYFLQNTHGVRQSGSAATDLAYVACGRYDGRYEFGLKPWDIAAGIIIIKQAGGEVCDFYGGSDYFHNETLIAANSKLLPELKNSIKRILNVLS